VQASTGVLNDKFSTAKKTAVNTIIIYVQRFSSAALSLITTPIVLNALGVADFGLYTLTVGFVGMLSFITWTLSSSTQRYIALALGEKNDEKLKRIFSTSIVIHLVYGLILTLGISTIGIFLQNTFLNIPGHRHEAANIILLLVTVLTFFTIITIPFTGVLRAHENFKVIAITGIVESSLKLIIAVLLIFASQDKLILYSSLLVVVTIIVFLINVLVTKKLYQNIRFNFSLIQNGLMKEMLSFMGWSLIGAVAIVSRNQGVSVLLNMFFGVIRNAAFGIALQVSAAIAILSQGVIGSISPQIIKAYGAGESDRMIFLMRTMSKFSIFSISIVAIPLFFEAPFILKLWLKEVPQDTVTYVRCIIIFGQIMLLSAGIQTVFDAIGKVKLYNLFVSVVLILNLPIAYLFFKMRYPSQTIIIIGMSLEVLSLIIRLQLLKKYVNFSLSSFWMDTIVRVIFPALLMSVILYAYKSLSIDSMVSVIGSFGLTLIIYPTLIFSISLEGTQKDFLKNFLNNLVLKLRK
jgi:O-antigen/teichoic acid export membrane protein